jgi:putative two-component system response regulator
MAVADVYDALRSNRCYKGPFSRDQAHEIIESGSGVQFDSAVVRAFLALEEEFDRVGREIGYT